MRLPVPRLFLFVFLGIFVFLSGVRAAEPFFKKGDVIALVGGEDMVVASEYGYLELLLVRALPDYRLRFRNLAWEGDTVFEQRRDLNFPSWEEQLDKIGATVVICQFGQMESIMGTRAPGFPGGFTAEDAKSAEGREGKTEAKKNPSADLSNSSAPSAVKSAADAVPPAEPGIQSGGLPPGTPGAGAEVRSDETPKPAGGTPTLPENPPRGLPEFIAAYEKLIERFSGGGKRRVLLVSPSPFAGAMDDPRNHRLDLFWKAAAALDRQPGRRSVHVSRSLMSGAASAQRAALNVAQAPMFRGIPQSVTEEAFSKARATFRAAATPHRDDGTHLSAHAHARIAHLMSVFLNPPRGLTPASPVKVPFNVPEATDPLLQLIIAKNRLWFHYWRPENWAFLAGDRTAQPSSRDHLDPTKRWFPPEREAFLPLIEAKEKEIDALARQLARP